VTLPEIMGHELMYVQNLPDMEAKAERDFRFGKKVVWQAEWNNRNIQRSASVGCVDFQGVFWVAKVVLN
jgi:hypothetical protein